MKKAILNSIEKFFPIDIKISDYTYITFNALDVEEAVYAAGVDWCKQNLGESSIYSWRTELIYSKQIVALGCDPDHNLSFVFFRKEDATAFKLANPIG